MNFVGAAAFGGTVGDVLDTFLFVPPPITVTRPVIALPDLPESWDGVRIAQLTDLHHGRLTGLDFIRRVIEMANDEKPDLIALTGDFVSSDRGLCEEVFQALWKLRARCGVYAVLGNHDHWSCPLTIRRLLTTGGIKVFDNSHVILRRGRDRLAIAGVGDLWSDVQDLPRTLGGVPESIPRVLLCHNPRYAKEMPPQPRVDLMLSGHTHGLSFRFPFRRRRPQISVTRRGRYVSGLIQAPHCQLYVSCGLGRVGLPTRFSSRRELTVITLRRKTSDPHLAAALPA